MIAPGSHGATVSDLSAYYAANRNAAMLQSYLIDGLAGIFLLGFVAGAAGPLAESHRARGSRVLSCHDRVQLRLVSRIYRTHTRIMLFHLGPVYAFSGLTVQTAMSWLVFAYAWLLGAPKILSRPVSIALEIAITLIAVVTFAWPLLGLHTRLEQEQGRLMGEVGERLRTISVDLHRRVDKSELDADAMNALNNSMSTLVTERDLLSKIPTWPWHPSHNRRRACHGGTTALPRVVP